MAKILCIETATEICAVCLSENGQIFSERTSNAPNMHASILTVFIEECLAEAGWKPDMLDAVAVSAGPGSYTGLRVGASVAKGLCYGLNKPLIAVNSLHALASAASGAVEEEPALLCPMIDARRMEVYMAVFDKQLKKIEDFQARIIENKMFSTYIARRIRIILCGNGAQKALSILDHPLISKVPVLASAKNLVPLAEIFFVEQQYSNLFKFTPFYLKPPNITTQKRTF